MRILATAMGWMFLCGHPAAAQLVSVGVEGGVLTTGDVSGGLQPESKRYIVGPMAEVRLPLHFSVEVDALYRRLGFTGNIGSIGFYGTQRERDDSWEFPIIVKYRLPGTFVHPFVGVGYAPRTVHGAYSTSGCTLEGLGPYVCGSNVIREHTNYPLTQGVVASGGLDFLASHLRISPEVRFVHWNAPFLNQYGGDGSFRYVSPQNELFVLVGLSWR